MANAPLLRDNLQCRVTDRRAFSGKQAIVYGWCYWTLRVTLIILAGLVAGAKQVPKLDLAQPYMAVLIVILTGIDTLFQAGTKWKTHYRYNDLYEASESELLSFPADDVVKLDAFRLKLDILDAAYRSEALV